MVGKNKLLVVLATMASIGLVSCGGGGSSGGGSSEGSGGATGLGQLYVSSQAEFPAHNIGSSFVAVYNKGDSTISNLQYALTGVVGSNITLDKASVGVCASIPAKKTCLIKISYNDTKAVSGAIMLSVSQKSLSSNGLKLNTLLSSSVASRSSGIGLINVPSGNLESGANASYVLAPVTVPSASTAGVTPVIVSVVVTSPKIGDVNTFELVDGKFNKISYASVVSGNSGGADYSLGSVVSFLLNVPAGVNQVEFKVKASKNSTGNVSYSSNSTVVNLSSASQAVVSMLPSSFGMIGKSFESQQIYLGNSGDVDATEVSISSIPLPEADTRIDVLPSKDSPCGKTIKAGEYCGYTVKLVNSEKIKSLSRLATLVLNYNSGKAKVRNSSRVEYSGTLPVPGQYGLVANLGDNVFRVTVANPSKSTNVTITNTGSMYNVTNVEFSLPTYFSLAADSGDGACTLDGNTVTNNLLPGGSCNLTLVYTNDSPTLESVAQLNVNYTYTDGATISQKDSLSPIDLIYSTEQSAASLSFKEGSSITFPSIINNGKDIQLESLTVVNNGGVAATNLSFDLAGSGFAIKDNSCAGTLVAGASCTLQVQFGPAEVANEYTGKVTLQYIPNDGAPISSTSIGLDGTVVQAGQANIYISAVNVANSIDGDGRSLDSTFHVQQASNNHVVLTYKNGGEIEATDFAIDTSHLIGGYTLSDDGCSGKILGSNQTCALTLTMPDTVGQNDLSLASDNIAVSWKDPAGSHDSQSVYWKDIQGTYSNVFVDSFIAPSIAVKSLSTDSSRIIQGESFDVLVSLNGGYSATSANVNVSNISALAQAKVNVTPSSCVLTLDSSSCVLHVIANKDAVSGSKSLEFQASVAINPSTLPFEVFGAPLITFSSASGTVPQLVPGGSFDISAVLSGGKPSTHGSFNVSNVSELQALSVGVTPSSCDLNQTKTSCTLHVTSDFDKTPTGELQLNFSSDVALSQPSFSFDVIRKVIFVTSKSFKGGNDVLKTKSGADAACKDAAKQFGLANAVALLTYPDRYYRTSTSNIPVDWPIKANTVYVRTDGKLIGKTDASKQMFNWPLSNPIGVTGTSQDVWSGLEANTFYMSDETRNCRNWTDPNLEGTYADTSTVNQPALATMYTNFCNTEHPIYCVEQ